MYVSDRRLVKAVGLLKVAAFTCGRSQVNELDCLLLQHVLWQRPEERPRLREWLLKRVAKDASSQQARGRGGDPRARTPRPIPR